MCYPHILIRLCFLVYIADSQRSEERKQNAEETRLELSLHHKERDRKRKQTALPVKVKPAPLLYYYNTIFDISFFFHCSFSSSFQLIILFIQIYSWGSIFCIDLFFWFDFCRWFCGFLFVGNNFISNSSLLCIFIFFCIQKCTNTFICIFNVKIIFCFCY